MKNIAKGILLLIGMVLLLSPVFADDQASEKVLDKAGAIKAISAYTKKIEANPNSEEGYINRAYLNYLLGNLEEAIQDYDKLVSLSPKNEEFLLNRGYLKHINNEREEALKDYDLALQINPKYAFAYNNRGVVLAELGRSEESMTAYNTAIKIDPNYADAYYNRGNLKTRTEKNEEALSDFNTAIKLNPTDSASFNNRGVVKRKLNYNVGALSDFSIAIKLNPEDITALANRGRLKKRYYDSEGAEDDFKAAIAIADESPVLVKELELEKQLAEASKSVKATPVTDNNNTILSQPKVAQEPIQKISQTKLATDKADENIKIASVKTSLVKVEPKVTNANLEVKTPEQANPVLVAKSTPTTTPNTTANQAQQVKTTAQVASQPAKQPATSTKTIAINGSSQPEIATKPVVNPKLAECYYIRALQKYILQNRESALKDFDMAIQYNPEYAEAYYYRAAIKRDMKDDGFVDDYKKAIQIDPGLKAVNDADVLTILKI